ncbi:hypothetical protein [Vibrio furnissii]|uniref:hypothetical protein n=1 Tax=Vibrio furnissii TaxID=29494 RepID=UPI0018EF2F75|nr:hypothetical protein [Vibrio furnissii]
MKFKAITSTNRWMQRWRWKRFVIERGNVDGEMAKKRRQKGKSEKKKPDGVWLFRGYHSLGLRALQ